ncbi:hypothetical protein [Kocuria rhizophila]
MLGTSSRGSTDRASSPDEGVSHGWIPSGERWLAVDVHEPSAPARGATVVVAAPPGRERVTMTRTVLHTARALAADGWRVVRFDWSGTGQSPSLADACEAGHWAQDMRAVREWAGAGSPVHGVAFSVAGAYMAADEDHGWSERVLLAPVSGNQWLRHQSALRRMAGADLPPRVTQGTELMDLQLTSEGAAAVKAVPAPAEDPARGLRVVGEDLTGALPLDIHPRAATVPEGLTSTVTRAVAEHAPARGAATRQSDAEDEPARSLTLDVHGTAVRVSRTTVGHGQRPAILTEPVERAAKAPGLALISPGSDVMETASGLWLHTALLASGRGAVCLLAERTDTGELVDATLTRNSNPYARHTVVESREIITRLADLTDGPLTAAGICLGAWGLVAAAPELPRAVAGRLTMHVVNNVAWQREPWRYWRQGLSSGPLAPRLPGEEAPAPEAAPEQATPAPPSARRALVSRVGSVGRTVVRGTRAWAHAASPRINSLAATAGIIDVPQPALRRLARIPGLTVKAVFGPADAAHCHVTAAQQDERSALVLLEPLDHSVFATASRDTLARYIVDETTATRPAGH